MLKIIKRVISFVVLSFAGGFFAVLFLSWKGRGIVPQVDQALSIANTYIVFTTFIFVAFTVLLTIVGYVLAQTFAANASAHHTDTIDKIKDCIANDDEKATQVLTALISSPQVQNRLTLTIREKIHEELQARRADAQMFNNQSATDLQTIDSFLFPDANGPRARSNGSTHTRSSEPESRDRFSFERSAFTTRRPRPNNDERG